MLKIFAMALLASCVAVGCSTESSNGGGKAEGNAAAGGSADDHGHSHDGNDPGHSHDDDASGSDKKTGKLLDPEKYDHFAEGVHDGDVMTVAALLANPDDHIGKTLRVSGKVTAVCKKKGCWLRVGDDDSDLFAKFKVCDSYMPTDAEGDVIVEGIVKVEEVSVDEQKHLLEDEGKADEAAKITEPKRVVRMTASGAAMPRS